MLGCRAQSLQMRPLTIGCGGCCGNADLFTIEKEREKKMD